MQALERIDSAPLSVLSSLDAQLARGRVLASWPGHSLDAKHLYDGLIEAHPDDARPMLAKGLLLRQQGRGVDADRAFLQARALVPPEQRAGLDAVIGR